MLLRRAASILIALAAILMGGVTVRAQARPLDQHAMFRVVAALYNLDPALLEAIATVESGGDAWAVSPAGAQGLMQLMPATARRFRVADPFDPVDNALGAARFLDYLRRWEYGRGGGVMGLPEFLAAYNAGEGAVDKYHGIPPYPETQEYVRRVLLEYVLSPMPENSPRHPSVRHKKAAAIKRPTAAQAERGVLEQLDQLRQMRARAVANSTTAASAQ